jgi:hypothetical protein
LLVRPSGDTVLAHNASVNRWATLRSRLHLSSRRDAGTGVADGAREDG